ncbi:MAG: DnaJ C-terminal domain-containing protein [Vicinamibacteria bacterium]
MAGVEFKDYYKILGVERTATPKEIKAAFRKLARKFHPDLNKGDAKAEARFKEVNEAHEVLSDTEKRQRYDTLGPDWANMRPQGGGPGPGWGGGTVDFNSEDLGGFSDFFRTIFGGGGFGARPGGPRGGGFEEGFGGRMPDTPGHDLETTIELTLDEVARGTTRTVKIGDDGNARTVEVRIPAGVRESSRVRAAGEGAPGARGRRGDLYMKVHVLPHPQFERKGDDLQTTVTVPLTTAVLGGETEVPTLNGPIGIKIPPGSRPGRTLRLRGHGLPRLEAAADKGDLLALLAVTLPQELSERERELFEELKTLGR